MKYIRYFENIEEDLNKIFLIDFSASFYGHLVDKLQTVNFYLAKKFTTILCDYSINAVYNNITIDELALKVNMRYQRVSAGGDLQIGIDYIIDKQLKGNILIFSDGYFKIDISKLKNKVTVLSTDTKPEIIGGDYMLFYNDLESLDQYYPPRDTDYEEYILRKSAKKYNL